MSGVTIVGNLLRASGAYTAKVQAANIKAGQLPEGAPLPATLLRTVSRSEMPRLKRGAVVRKVERVAVTVRCGDYRTQGELIGLIVSICAGRTGSVGGGERVSILAAGTGPDVIGPGNSFEQTQDLRVSYDEAA